jgi:hypothetical protein
MAALALCGCATHGPTPDTLMALPREQVFEVRQDAAVPAAVAYKNILERARRCWQDRFHVLNAESFSSKVGSARMSVRYAGYGFAPEATQMVIEVMRADANSTRLVGRSIAPDGMPGRDLRDLQLWAEGKAAGCS